MAIGSTSLGSVSLGGSQGTTAGASSVTKTLQAIWDINYVAAPWWNSSWLRRRAIEFDNTANAEELTNFPTLVKLDSTRITYADTLTAGADIRFVYYDGATSTELKYEIEEWNASGTSIVWVKLPTVLASKFTVFYVYYKNSGASDAQDAANVWSNGYEAVYHFKETTSTYSDSTGNGHTSAAIVGSLTRGTEGSLGLGNCPGFSGTTPGGMFIPIANTPAWTAVGGATDNYSYCIEAFVKWANSGDIMSTGTGGITTGYPVVAKGYGEADGSATADVQFNLSIAQTTGYPGIDFEDYRYASNNNAPSVSSTGIGTSSARHIAGVLEGIAAGTSAQHKLYLRGSLTSNVTLPATPQQGVQPTLSAHRVCIGAAEQTNGTTRDGQFNGYIDEVRISHVARTAAWVACTSSSLEDAVESYNTEENAPAASSVNIVLAVICNC